MKVKDIFSDTKTLLFAVIDSNDDNALDWEIEPTDFDIIPEEENMFFIKALQVSRVGTTDCYMSVATPERIAEYIIKSTAGRKVVVESIFAQTETVIPAVASDCFGIYDLFYAKENPQIGIDILRDGLSKATNKHIVAEDLGYILRDEGRVVEAIEAFEISEKIGPSSVYIYWELSQLYGQLGRTEERSEYERKFKKGG